jgi:hypothetical protein
MAGPGPARRWSSAWTPLPCCWWGDGDAERLLRERFAIAPEGSDLRGVVCMVTIGDTPASVDQLVGAFTALAAQHPPHPAPRCRRPCGAPARSPSRQCRRAQVHICGPDDPTLDRVAVVDGV